MITPINNTIDFLKNLFIETFLNNTNKVSVVSESSIMNATAYGVGKIAQKAMKDSAIVEAQLFPESASGTYLDKCASLYGVPPRKGALGSSTYVRVRCSQSGVVFPNDGSVTFINTNNIVFNIKESVTVDASLYAYIPVESVLTGEITNVDANTILRCNNAPAGFIECTNEYVAIGGRDNEDDEVFRLRIINNMNSLSISTIEYITQVLQNINSNILKVLYTGYSASEGVVLYVVTQNGALFSDAELQELERQLLPYMSLQNYIKNGAPNVTIKNITWSTISVDFKAELRDTSTSAINATMTNIQVLMSKYLDFRFWQPEQKVIWSDLLQIAKSDPNVISLPNTSFTPNSDISVISSQLPRIQGFTMRDLNGNIYSSSALTPIFYSNI